MLVYSIPSPAYICIIKPMRITRNKIKIPNALDSSNNILHIKNIQRSKNDSNKILISRN